LESRTRFSTFGVNRPALAPLDDFALMIRVSPLEKPHEVSAHIESKPSLLRTPG
jgi:hypothetical protein